MEKRTKNTEEFKEVNVRRLWDAVLGKAWLIVLVSLLFAAIVFAGTYFLVTPLYQSSTMFYVNNSSISVGETSLSIDSGDISASKSLVNTYIVILDTRLTLTEVIDYADLDRTVGEVRDMIDAQPVDETEVFRVMVTSDDPAEAEKIANAIAYVLPNRITDVVEGTSAKVVDEPIKAVNPSSPSYTMNTLIGFLIGFVLSAGMVILQELFDSTVRDDDDINQVCKHPILAAVPDMSAPSKGSSHYYAYGNRRKSGKSGHSFGKQSVKEALIGSRISFSASEAYKLLRTKLQFSFSDENHCRVIGLSSALSGEGKSLTSINLAYTLSQLDKKVLLIDCDMRRPTLADKLEIQKKPGLSSFLTGQSPLHELIQNCGIQHEENAFHVIAAGQNPPNPIELLSSARMERGLSTLREIYDYIILDLPPVGEVSDALAVAKQTDGMLIVVRQNYCNRVILGDVIRQFEFVDSKILGVIYNCANEGERKYSKGYYKSYYRRYHRRYYSRAAGKYERSFRAANEAPAEQQKGNKAQQ